MESNITEANLTGWGNSQVLTRVGLNIGPGVSVMINKKGETSMELLFSQNASYASLVQIPSVDLNKITLN